MFIPLLNNIYFQGIEHQPLPPPSSSAPDALVRIFSPSDGSNLHEGDVGASDEPSKSTKVQSNLF